MISCCSCPVTPNALVSLSARNDLISNTLTPGVPTSVLLASAGASCNASTVGTGANVLATGIAAWVEALLRRLPTELVQKLIGDPQQFEQALRQTRNHLTHLGGKVGAKVITDAGSLFLMNQKLHALLRLLVLTDLGFPAESVFDPVYQQSRKMTVL